MNVDARASRDVLAVKTAIPENLAETANQRSG